MVAPAASDPLEQAQAHIDNDRYMSARDVLEEGVRNEPERSDLRLKLMEAYGQQGDRDGFVAQERHLMAHGGNPAQVDELKARFPAMAGLAAGLSAAAVAAELDAQYVKDLLQDDASAPEPIGDVFDTNFDLSLDGIEPVAADATPETTERTTPRDEVDFETLLRESAAERSNAEPEPEVELEQAADAEQATARPAPSEANELDALGHLETPRVLGEDESSAPERTHREQLDDFDLALSSEQLEDQDRFAADVNDVNAQLDELSNSLGQASLDNGLHGEGRAGEGLDEFDFLSDSDEVTTKLDLARAYIEMADAEGARDILDEVLKEGTMAQQKEARKMLATLS